jgi:hypothetical protein
MNGLLLLDAIEAIIRHTRRVYRVRLLQLLGNAR